jgi:hypothetical protein
MVSPTRPISHIRSINAFYQTITGMISPLMVNLSYPKPRRIQCLG